MHRGMQAKTINSILKRKFNLWVNSIEDDNIKAMIRKDSVITGGCITSMLLGEPINDFDVYFKTRKTAAAVANYYIGRFEQIKNLTGSYSSSIKLIDEPDKDLEIRISSSGIAEIDNEENTQVDLDAFETDYEKEVFEKDETPEDSLTIEAGDFEPVFLSSNAISLKGKIQIITRFIGTPEEIHKNYDFVHCTNYWESFSSKLTLNPKALEATLSKTLFYQGSLYPICSLFRIRKFVERGWKINAGQILKMCIQVNNLNLKDINVLKDQLTGVDTAYFAHIIQAVHNKNSETIDGDYLIEVINKIF